MPFYLQIMCYLIGSAMIVHYWCVANFLPRSAPYWMSAPIAVVFGAAMMLVVSAYQSNILFATISFALYATSSVWIQIMLWLHGFRVNHVARSLSTNGINWNEVIADLRGQTSSTRSSNGIA